MKLFNFTICNNHKIIEILGIKIKLKYSNSNTVKNCIAIVTNSGIGDYLLYSPYLKYIKKKYKSNYIIFFARGMFFNYLLMKIQWLSFIKIQKILLLTEF